MLIIKKSSLIIREPKLNAAGRTRTDIRKNPQFLVNTEKMQNPL